MLVLIRLDDSFSVDQTCIAQFCFRTSLWTVMINDLVVRSVRNTVYFSVEMFRELHAKILSANVVDKDSPIALIHISRKFPAV